MRAVVAGIVAALTLVSPAAAQNGARPSQDSLSLGALHAEALRLDPRRQQLALEERATDLRLRNIAADRLPTLSLNGQAQHQSTVTTLPLALPGTTIPVPPHDTYDAHLGVEEPLFDPSLAPRRAVERARLQESQAQIRTSLFSLRHELDDAFFDAASLQERIAVIDAAIAGLDARLRETARRFLEGAATPGDTSMVAATLLQRRQDRLQLDADRVAALARLSSLAGRQIDDEERLVVPDLAAAATRAARALDTLRARPEFDQFRATSDRLARQEEAVSAEDRPRVSAFGRLGHGRPGLDMLSSDFQSYWLAGVQLQWTPWRWGTASRDRALLEIDRAVTATNEAAFARSLQRAVQAPLATIARRDSTLALDDRIIALRERVTREAESQLREGAITTATYVERSTELLTARLQRIQHRVELERAHATLLDTLGVEIP